MLDAQVSTPGHIACMYKPPHHDTYEHQSRDVKSHMLLWRANCVHVCGKRASWRLLGAHSIGSRVTAHVSLMYILEHVGSMLHDLETKFSPVIAETCLMDASAAPCYTSLAYNFS
jgi:hypothetical protein